MVRRTRSDWRSALLRLVRDAVRFGAVGAVGFVVDIGLFNAIAYGPAAEVSPVAAKVISVTVATALTWLGNRYFVFRDRRGRAAGREAVLFVLFSLTGMAIAVGTLWFSHYVLRMTSPLADNVSANVIGLGLATMFRFVTYRTVVFRHVPAVSEVPPSSLVAR